MAKFIGRLSQVGVAKETVRGTPVAPTIGFKWLDLTLEGKTESVRNEQAFGKIWIGDDSTVVKRWGEITAKMKLHDISLGYFLLATLGAVNSTEKIAPNTGVFDHLFSVAESNQHPSLTISHKSPNEDERFALGMIDTLKFEVEPGGYPTVEAAMRAKEPVSASNTIVYQVERDFLSKQMTFKYADDIAGLGAASPVDIRKLTIEIKKNLFDEDVIGNVTPVDFMNQGFEVTGNITLIHNNTTFEQIQNQELAKAFEFTFTHTDTIGTSANPLLQLVMNKVKLMNYEANRSPNDIVEESFDFEAFYKLSDAEGLTALLTNETASY